MSFIFSNELLTALMAAAGATTAAGLASQVMRPRLVEQRARREKVRARLKEQVTTKVANGIRLKASEISDIGRGLGLHSGESVSVLYELYAEATEQDHHEFYKQLIEELHRDEPFEALPDEARPSLSRLATLCADSSQSSDADLLHPITKLLGEYQEMKADHASIKKQSRVSYVVALISFFIGVVGLVLAFSGPSKSFIKEELDKNAKQIEERIDAAQQGAAGDV